MDDHFLGNPAFYGKSNITIFIQKWYLEHHPVRKCQWFSQVQLPFRCVSKPIPINVNVGFSHYHKSQLFCCEQRATRFRPFDPKPFRRTISLGRHRGGQLAQGGDGAAAAGTLNEGLGSTPDRLEDAFDRETMGKSIGKCQINGIS